MNSVSAPPGRLPTMATTAAGIPEIVQHRGYVQITTHLHIQGIPASNCKKGHATEAPPYHLADDDLPDRRPLEMRATNSPTIGA